MAELGGGQDRGKTDKPHHAGTKVEKEVTGRP